jgi:hypothetical protein
MTGMVRRPHAKNSRKMTTRAWYTLGSPIPDVCNKTMFNNIIIRITEHES